MLRQRGYPEKSLIEKVQTIVLKLVVDKRVPDSYVIKNGRKIFAKMSGPDSNGEWLVNFHGTGRYFDSKEKALDYVRENAESKLNLFGFSNKVVIKG